jgi:hypothetical protein
MREIRTSGSEGGGDREGLSLPLSPGRSTDACSRYGRRGARRHAHSLCHPTTQVPRLTLGACEGFDLTARGTVKCPIEGSTWRATSVDAIAPQA